WPGSSAPSTSSLAPVGPGSRRIGAAAGDSNFENSSNIVFRKAGEISIERLEPDVADELPGDGEQIVLHPPPRVEFRHPCRQLAQQVLPGEAPAHPRAVGCIARGTVPGGIRSLQQREDL